MAPQDRVTPEQTHAWLRAAIANAAGEARRHEPESPLATDHRPTEPAAEREAAVRYLDRLLNDDISDGDRQCVSDTAGAVLGDPRWAMDSLAFEPASGVVGLAEESFHLLYDDIDPDGELMSLIDTALLYRGRLVAAIAWVWACDVATLVDAAERKLS